jgi:membrane-bound serine protease (ClpP class)
LRKLLLLFLILLPLSAAGADPAPVVRLRIDGAVGPAAADYFHRVLTGAAKQNAQLVVLQMDTPGGLDTSMRAIIKDILASPVPVAAYVAPGGARAASAGTYILYASHIAAMAPGTNLGAATPVAIGGPSGGERKPEGRKDDKAKDEKEDKDRTAGGDTMTRKQVNDAAAYIRGLAQLRGRNADWAERAVREAVSLSASEALSLKVIDVVADDLPGLLKQLDRRSVSVGGSQVSLATAGAAVVERAPDWRTRALSVITDPSIAYILLLVGIYALVFEFANPGMVLPGVAGAICVLIALYAFHLLPVNYAGLALVLLGLAFMAAELFFPAYGSLGVGGAIAFVTGSVMLIDTDVPEFAVPIALIVGLAAVSAVFVFLMAAMALKSRRRPVVSGREQMIGSRAVVLEDCESEGWARVQGETWRIRCPTPLKAGQTVRVAAMHGLLLHVVPESNQGA